MNTIAEGFLEALRLIFTFDPEVYEVVGLSLFVSLTAVALSALVSVPAAVWAGLQDFRWKRLLSRLAFTLMSVPSVVVGLVVVLLFSRRGPLGFFDLLYTPALMIVAQAVLISPLIFGLVYHSICLNGTTIRQEGFLLGARGWRLLALVIWEQKRELTGHGVAGFSRAISEVGTVMIVGGNIKGQTRVMTTSIAMMNSMGEYQTAIALGVVLLVTSLTVNSLLYQEKHHEP